MLATMSIRTTNGSILRPRWKSALDITCILLSLPVWLPLMILLMLVTRIASPGPIFYRQERIGFGGRHFFVWKFRTMKLSAETQIHERHFEELMRVDCPMTKLDAYGDPRLAPFGRILRASGLDELPQIFNVLCGEMSLVGPRPCTPNEFAHYEPWQRERVNGLPGLTGYWQVNGKNKTTFNQMIWMGSVLPQERVDPARSENYAEDRSRYRWATLRIPAGGTTQSAEWKPSYVL
jgi:exopolysaccharide production protein ExoY